MRRAAWNTITAELAKPTSTVTKPAASAEREKSRATDTRPLYTPGVRAYLLSRLATDRARRLPLADRCLLPRAPRRRSRCLLFLPMDIQAKDVERVPPAPGLQRPAGRCSTRASSGGAVRGDFGESLRYKRDALGLVLERLPATLLAGGAPRSRSTFVRRGPGRRALGGAPRLGCSTTSAWAPPCWARPCPGFWLGLMLIYLFSVQLGWLPTGRHGRSRATT